MQRHIKIRRGGLCGPPTFQIGNRGLDGDTGLQSTVAGIQPRWQEVVFLPNERWHE
jgi:hypothetical protein